MTTDPDNVVRGIWNEEDRKKPKSADGGLGHDELRDRWLERYPGRAYSRKDWWRYADGWWRTVDEEAIEGEVLDVLEGSKEEGVKPTASLLSSVSKLARATVYESKEIWDRDPDLLVLPNGTLKISTRTLREHRPEDYITSSLPYEYDPEAVCDVFKAVLTKAVPDCVEFLQEYAGLCLTPHTRYEMALWFKGPRGSGKSTVIQGLTTMLGQKYGVLGLGEIEMSRFALGRIPGKTLLVSTEQPASYLKSTHVVDALISGEPLTVERKNRDAEEIEPVAKVIWAMNDLPRIANTTSGIFRRVKVVNFPELEGDRRPEVKEYIKDEGPGILNWALEGLARLQERERFEIPASIKTATEEFQLSNDLPAQFVDEVCVTGADCRTSTRYLYDKYAEWCSDGGHRAPSINRVSEDWKRLGFKYEKTNQGRFWRGVRAKIGEGF